MILKLSDLELEKTIQSSDFLCQCTISLGRKQITSIIFGINETDKIIIAGDKGAPSVTDE